MRSVDPIHGTAKFDSDPNLTRRSRSSVAGRNARGVMVTVPRIADLGLGESGLLHGYDLRLAIVPECLTPAGSPMGEAYALEAGGVDAPDTIMPKRLFNNLKRQNSAGEQNYLGPSESLNKSGIVDRASARRA
jgi:hypothetical protein